MWRSLAWLDVCMCVWRVVQPRQRSHNYLNLDLLISLQVEASPTFQCWIVAVFCTCFVWLFRMLSSEVYDSFNHVIKVRQKDEVIPILDESHARLVVRTRRLPRGWKGWKLLRWKTIYDDALGCIWFKLIRRSKYHHTSLRDVALLYKKYVHPGENWNFPLFVSLALSGTVSSSSEPQ